MTENRFKLYIMWYNKEKTEGEAELTDNGQPLLITNDIVGARLIKDCLNELIEENEQLKTQLQNTSDQRDEFHRGARENANRVGELEKENEQLKQQLIIYRKLTSCNNCNYHNYDWYDDGDEFEVCDKGNDVTNGICKDWREL